jgi:hypothetical protein
MTTTPESLYALVSKDINWDNLIPTCLALGQAIENVGAMKGSEKLALLQDTLRYALKESSLSEEKKADVLSVIDGVVPIIMTAAVSASKHPIVKNAVEQVSQCCGFSSKK